MDRIAIEGGARLVGRIPVSGAKNSALKVQAACLLSPKPLVLTNMPRLADTLFMVDLLRTLGVRAEWDFETGQLELDAATITSTVAPYDLVRKMRATFNVLGPLLAREGHAEVSLPGGCAIGARPVDLHLKTFEAMGAQIELKDGNVHARAPNGLKGAYVVFPFISVGATEHAMLSAVLAHGETVLENAAREPEIADLAACLNAMGAKIEGAGSRTIHIHGVTSLNAATHHVVGDRIEAGTFAIAAAVAQGDVVLDGVEPVHLSALLSVLEQAGAKVEIPAPHQVRVLGPTGRLKAVDVETQPFPGFPTDLQAQFMGAMCVATGASMIRESIFENRFMHAPELMRLGADITVRGETALVRGVETLRGAPVMATDLRASVSLVIAGLAAEGETMVHRVYHLDRGFERLEAKLSACGAKVRRLKN